MMLHQTHRLFVLAALLLLGGVAGWAYQPVVLAEPANYDCATQGAIPVAQCEALVAIYNANPDANLSGWLADGSSPCDWSGVGCLGGGVTTLHFVWSHLTTIPAEIGQLSSLQSLYLKDNQLTSVPTEIGQLSNLENLDLERNQLAAVPTEIGNLSNLQILNLGWNQLTSVPAEIGQLSNLENLYLDGNQLMAVPDEVGQLSNLQWLSLNGNQLTAVPAEIGQLSNLQYLSVFFNQLTAVPAEIGQLSNLQSLYLGSNQLTAVPTEFGQLSNLRGLSLDHNQLTAVPAEIWQLTSLISLTLGGNQLTAVPAEIGQLTNLQWLSLYNNQLTAIPAEIGQLSNLEWLELYGNQLTALPTEIGQLSSLRDLYLSGNQLCELPLSITSLTPTGSPSTDPWGGGPFSIGSNHLTPTNPALINWLNTYNPFWAGGQTPCPFSPSITLNAPNHTVSATAGNTITYTIHITNTGDAHDTFALTATNQAWTTNVPASINLAAGAADTFAVQVQVPLTATHGAQDSVSITAVSGISETVTATVSLTTTAVEPVGYDCAAQVAIPLAQCEALVAIYNANPSGSFSGWLADGSSPCDWGGITCSGGVVTQLNLSSHNLTAVPAEIGQLSNLTSLTLSNNQLIAVLAEFGQLNNLQQLWLSNNQLTNVPTELGQLSNLRYLDLRVNQFTTVPAAIWELSNLQMLYLDSNQLTAVPAEIGQLNLRRLWLSSNQLTAVPAEIGQLSNLQQLYLDNNQLTTVPAQIGQLSNLTHLRLNNNQLTAVPVQIGQLSNLQSLELSNNQLTAMPSQIGQLSNLQYLYLSFNQLTAVPAEIGQLNNLRELWLMGNQLTAIPAEIGLLSNLQWLILPGNQLTAVPAEIGQLSNLQWLWLNHNQLTAVPAEVGQLSNLTQLWLHNNQLMAVPAEVGQLSNLQDLSLDNNHLTAVPAEVGQLNNLQWLHLSFNQLAAVPTEIGQLGNLQYLYMHNNPLNGTMPTTLTSLNNLVTFSFYNTNWCIPASPNTVQTWLNGIATVVGTGRICDQPAGAISGQITLTNTLPITQTSVILYRQTVSVQRQFVATTQPNAQGEYSFGELGQGINYFVHFVPPSNTLAPQYYNAQGTLNTATPVTVTLGMTSTHINATFGPAVPPLATITTPNGSVTPNPLNGTVVVGQANGQTAAITVTSIVLCADESVPTAVALTLGNQSYPMNSTGNPNEYSATIPANEVASGTLTVVATCAGGDESTILGAVTLFDPSGLITDAQTGNPVVGATVTLHQVPNWQPKTNPTDTRANTCQSNLSKAEGAPWSQPAPTELGVQVNTDVTTVAPLISQQTTNNVGYYGWDVPEGCWYVTVQAEGYEPLTSPVVGVPTEVTDLDLVLQPLGWQEGFEIYLPLIMR